MEIIVTLINYLTASLTPVQFLLVITLFGIALTFATRYLLAKRKEIRALIKGEKEEDQNLKSINEKLERAVTQEHLEESVARVELVLRHELSEIAKNVRDMRERFVEISVLRHEIVDKEFARLFEELHENRKVTAAYQEQSVEQRSLILSTASKLHDISARSLSQIEKIDEYLKAAVPEFRGYHRELGTDIKMLSRDLALVERSIQLSINTGSAVKLR